MLDTDVALQVYVFDTDVALQSWHIQVQLKYVHKPDSGESLAALHVCTTAGEGVIESILNKCIRWCVKCL